MRKFGVAVLMTGTAVWLTGCGMQFGKSSATSATGGLAVVDLEKVASETGKSIQFKEMLQATESVLNQQLAQATNNAKSQLGEKAKELGEAPTEEQQKQFAKTRYEYATALNQLQTQAGSKFNQYKMDQVAKFRAEIKPIALEIARERGLSVVVPKNDGLLLAVDSGVDITEDVIKAYREKRPAAAAAPAAATAPKPAKAPEAPAKTVSKPKAEEATK